MTLSHRCWILAAAVVALSALPASAQVTSDVFQASIGGSLAGFDDSVEPAQLIKQKIFTGPILNTARNRSPLAVAPASEILAVAVSREDPPLIQVIVWDTISQSNLVTIARSETISGGDTGKKGLLVTLLDIADTGGATYAFLDGFLVLSGSYSVDPAGNPVGLSVSAVGVIDGRVEGIEGEALLTKGKLKAAKTPVGVLVEAP